MGVTREKGLVLSAAPPVTYEGHRCCGGAQQKEGRWLRYGLQIAAQRERGVERGPSHDVHADAQPVRIQVRVADPALKVRHSGRERSTRRHDRPCRGEPEEVSTGQLHLRDEEVVIGRERMTFHPAYPRPVECFPANNLEGWSPIPNADRVAVKRALAGLRTPRGDEPLQRAVTALGAAHRHELPGTLRSARTSAPASAESTLSSYATP